MRPMHVHAHDLWMCMMIHAYAGRWNDSQRMWRCCWQPDSRARPRRIPGKTLHGPDPPRNVMAASDVMAASFRPGHLNGRPLPMSTLSFLLPLAARRRNRLRMLERSTESIRSQRRIASPQIAGTNGRKVLASWVVRLYNVQRTGMLVDRTDGGYSISTRRWDKTANAMTHDHEARVYKVRLV